MKRKVGLSILVVVGVLAAVSSGVALAASSDYDIEMVDGIETTTETIDIANDEYEIDEVGVIEPGGTTTFDVTSPDSYDVLLYTTDEQLENRVGGESSDQFTVGDGGDLDTSALDPGTYMLSLEPDGEGRQAVAPVVKQGYDLSLSYPSTVEAGSEVTFEATAEPLDGMDRADEVTIAIWDGEEETEIALKQDDGTPYEATQPLPLEPGTYDVYGAVSGDDRVEGYPTALAVSEGGELTVTDGEDDELAGGPGGGTDDNESDDGTDEETEPDEGEGNETAEPDESDEKTEAEDNETTQPTDNETETGDDDDGDAGTEDTVIEPNDVNDTERTETDDTVDDDGLGTPTAITGVIALAGFLVAVALRTRR